jgi:hypothetical protein
MWASWKACGRTRIGDSMRMGAMYGPALAVSAVLLVKWIPYLTTLFTSVAPQGKERTYALVFFMSIHFIILTLVMAYFSEDTICVMKPADVMKEVQLLLKTYDDPPALPT